MVVPDQDNSVSKILKTIKKFMSEAKNEKALINGEYVSYHNNEEYKLKRKNQGER